MTSGAAAERAHDTTVALDDLFRRHSGQMVAVLTRIFGPARIDLAQEVVQDALLKAMQHWSWHGVPEKPSAWLIQAARNRALDVIRRERRLAAAEPAVLAAVPAADAGRAEPFEDDQLCLMFLCCHPDVSREARIALTLKTVCGFSVPEIARAFLAEETAIAQRLVRAKRLIRDRGLEFAVPEGEELAARLDAVLEVLYLVFNEGYAASAGDVLIRDELIEDAIHFTLLLTRHDETALPQTWALLALMLFHAARLPARTSPDGELALIDDQDRSLWDRQMIAAAMQALDRSAAGPAMSVWHAQAAIAGAHAVAKAPDGTDWKRIVHLYDDLLELQPSPVVRLNRAIAIARAHDPQAGLDELRAIAADRAIEGYYLYHAAAAHLLALLGDRAAAAECYRAALRCPCNRPEQRFLERKLEELR